MVAEGGHARQVSSYVFAAIVRSDVKLDKQMLKCMLLHMSGKSCLQLGQLQTSYAKTSTGILCLLGSENRFRRLEHLHASKCKCMRDLHEGCVLQCTIHEDPGQLPLHSFHFTSFSVVDFEHYVRRALVFIYRQSNLRGCPTETHPRAHTHTHTQMRASAHNDHLKVTEYQNISEKYHAVEANSHCKGSQGALASLTTAKNKLLFQKRGSSFA